MSAVSQQQEVPVGPDDALAVVNAQQQTHLKRHVNTAAPLLTAWGLAWLIGYVALALYREPDYGLPRAPYLFFCGCLTVALLFTVAYIVPKARGIRGRSSREGTYYGLAWALGMPWAWWIMSVAGGGGMLVAAAVSAAAGVKRGA